MTKVLAATQIRLNLVDLLSSASDPSSGGVAAAIGSLLLRSGTGQAWLKTGAANTAWSKLVQSFAWFSVKDFGAKGDNSTDDTAAVQAAIDACATAGGGRVWFPSGTYRCSQLTLTSQDNVQLQGAGPSSVIRWTWNAATAAGSLITITGSNHVRIAGLKFDGAGLTNPAASRLNHLIAVGTGSAGFVETQINQCMFTGMVANSGDGIHVLGAAGQLTSRVWIVDNYFDGCSRFGVGSAQGWEYGWIVNNSFTNCETDIALVATAALASTAILLHGNIINHTGTTRHALRIEGNAGAVYAKITVAENVILGGFATTANVNQCVISGNVITSGAFASADAAWKISGLMTYLTMNQNLVNRASGASAGPVISLERASGNSPTLCRIGNNLLANDKAGGTIVTVVDCSRCSVGANLGRSADATGLIGYDIQAVAANVTEILLQGNQLTAAANTATAGVRLLCNGANIVDISVVGNQCSSVDYGAQFEVAGGGGNFTGQLLYGSNNMNAVTGDINNVGVTVRPRIGFNAGSVGPQLFQGTGSPEGVMTARIGSMYLRTDGGANSTVYYKESGTGNTGWVAIGGQPIAFGAGDLTTAATAVYFGPGYIATASAAEIRMAVTRPGTVRNLRVFVGAAGTDNQTVTYTVRKSGVDTALTCTLANDAAGAASDTTHSFTVAAGDQLSISVTKAAPVTAGQTLVTACVEIV